MPNIVRNVECPECTRVWTGSFPDEDHEDRKLCKDCAQRRIEEEQKRYTRKQTEKTANNEKGKEVE